MDYRYPSTPSTDSITTRVAKAVAAHNDTDPTALDPPLHEAIDTDALDSLFASTKNGPRRGRLVFEYRDQSVVVDANGDVSVEVRNASQEHVVSECDGGT